MNVGLATNCIRRSIIQSGEHDVISVPQIAFCENAIVLPDSEFRCDTKCAISRLVRSALSQRDKSVRFPFPFPWRAIGGKRETMAGSAPIRVGPGESVTLSDRRGRELELESPSPPLAGPPRMERRGNADFRSREMPTTRWAKWHSLIFRDQESHFSPQLSRSRSQARKNPAMSGAFPGFAF